MDEEIAGPEGRTGRQAVTVSQDASHLAESGPRAWATVALLAGLSVLSYVDRLILALLITPLKQDLALSDVQIGLLFGTTFAVFFGLASLPLARVADTRSRKRLIICAVLFWSLCTMLSAFAESFAILALLRAGLAVGEAALTPAALSLLTDMFPARTRILAITLFSTSGMAGAATAYIIGGGVLDLAAPMATQGGVFEGWRIWQIAFMLVGLPGIFLASAIALVTREPRRHGASSESPPIAAIASHMKQKGWLYIGLFGGTGFAQLVVNAVAAWAPAYLERTFALTAELAGYRFGFAQVFAAVGGTFFMPMLFRWLASTGRTVIASRLPALISIAGALCVAASPFFGGSWGFLGGIAVGGFLLLGVANMTILILQPLVPAQMRATITAVGLIGVTGFGLGLGPVLAAVINSVAEETANPLGWGIAGVALVGMVGASFFYALAANRFASAMAGENQAPA